MTAGTFSDITVLAINKPKQGHAQGACCVCAMLCSTNLTAGSSPVVQGGIAEELSAALQAGAPSFFREDDKTFYRASALLQRAAEAGLGPDSGQLASQVHMS